MAQPEIDIHNKCFSYILAIAECGTISAAAEKLYISQPALSRYLKNLEDRIGIKLFDRIDNRLFLTAVGQHYLEYAQQIYDLEDQMIKTMVQLHNESTKCIRLGIPEHWASYIIPPLMVPLHNVLPHVTLEIMDVNSMKLEELLLNHEVDLTISRRPNNQQSITSQFLHPDPIYLAVPKSLAPSLHTEGTSPEGFPYISISELPRLKYILPQKGQSLEKQIRKLFEDIHMVPDVSLRCRSIEASMRMVGTDYGCCFVSNMHRRSVDMRNPVSYFAINHPQAMLSIHVNYMAGRALPRHIEQFIHYIAATI